MRAHLQKRRVLMGLFKEVKCGRCDRRYSSIRGRCPYCGARKNRGGKRAADHGNRQLHFIGGTLFLIVVVVAVIILVSKSLKDNNELAPTPTINLDVTDGVDEVTATPRPETPDVETPEPTPTPTPTPAVTAITLNRTDFTLSFIGEQWTMKATLSPADSTAEIKWSSEDESVAIIDRNGVVTAIDRGWTYIVCEAGGVVEKCIVRVNADSILGGDDDDDDDDDSGGAVGLSHYDVTISAAESETFTLKVKGTSATPAFSSEDTGIATVSPDGVVKAVSKGTTNIVVSIDGQTLKCIVRVK